MGINHQVPEVGDDQGGRKRLLKGKLIARFQELGDGKPSLIFF